MGWRERKGAASAGNAGESLASGPAERRPAGQGRAEGGAPTGGSARAAVPPGPQRRAARGSSFRRLSSELADVDQALGQAEEAWLALAERAPR